MSNLDDYRLALAEMRDKLHDALAGGTAGAPVITGYRVTAEIMEEDLRLRPTETINFYDHRSKQEPGTRGPFLWQSAATQRAGKILRPYEPSEADVRTKNIEYADAIRTQLRVLNVKTHTVGSCDKQYFFEEHPKMEKAKNEFIAAVREWVNAHYFDPKFYSMSAVQGLATVLQERQDVVFSLRSVQNLGAGSIQTFDREVDFWEEALAFGAGCLPYLGNAMALVEAYEGRDLFCRELSPFERVLAVVSVILPGLSRIAKTGRAAYSASRLAVLYGRDAAKWSYIVLMGERATIHSTERIAIQEAGTWVRKGNKLSPQAVKDAEKALAQLMGKSVGGVPVKAIPPLSQTRKALLEELGILGKAKPLLKELDEHALARVADAAVTQKGADVGLAKGQLLEEFKESRTLKLLREPFGAKALGVEAGLHKIEFFPGHMLTDSAGRKITDGILARRLAASEFQQAWYGARSPQEIKRIQGVLEVWAVDEVKAGKSSAKGLSYKYDVTEGDRAALKAVALKRLENAKLKAAKSGQPLSATLENMEKQVASEYKLGEMGGQARSTIERLDLLEDGSLPSIFVGGDEYLVKIRSISKTKIFGVLPKDVPSKGMVERLTKPVKEGGEGLDFQVIGINISQKELEELATEVIKKAGILK